MVAEPGNLNEPIGQGAVAMASNATAVGQGASALAANSAAFGRGATATRLN